MAAKSYEAFERLVDQVVAEALELLPSRLHQEIIVRKFGLRDGTYPSERQIGRALGIPPSEVRLLGRQALLVLLEAQRDGLLPVGAYG